MPLLPFDDDLCARSRCLDCAGEPAKSRGHTGRPDLVTARVGHPDGSTLSNLPEFARNHARTPSDRQKAAPS